jgi:hypothetical protein
MILYQQTNPLTRAGIAQLATAAILFAFLSFTSGWRELLVLELGVFMVVSGTTLIVYGSTRRVIPFRGLATKWLPIGVPFLAVFVVLFGTGLAIAEDGDNVVGGALLVAGYLSLPARSIFRFVMGVRNRNR